MDAALDASAGVFAVAAMGLVSALEELGVLDEECFLWWTCAGGRLLGLAISAGEARSVEHDRHVQAPRRASSFEEKLSMLPFQIGSGSWWEQVDFEKY